MSVPDFPPDGSIVADLETLRVFVGARTAQDDVSLQEALFSAQAYVYERVYASHIGHPVVQHAILLKASRLYKRRQTPEGVGGFAGEGVVVRVTDSDPDVDEMLTQHIDYTRAGVA